MINKENNQVPVEPKKEDSFVDTAMMDVQCHILIKDKDTGDVLLNKRG